MQERVRETFESPVVPAAILVGSRLMRVKYLHIVLPTTHYKQILSSQTQTHHCLDARVSHAPPFQDIDPLPHVCLIMQTNEVVKALVEHHHGGMQSFVQYMMGHCRKKQLRMSPVRSEGVGRVRDGDGGGTERWQWHRDGDGGGMERVAAVAQGGQQQWHIEGRWTVWAACHCEWAACWGCEVCTVGGQWHVDGVRGCAGCVVMCQCVSGWCRYSWGMLENVCCVGHG